MYEKTVESWDGFRALILDIRREYGYHDIDRAHGEKYQEKNIVLFRGQNDSDWGLRTTLERKTNKKFDVAQYVMVATGCAEELESLTGRAWIVGSIDEVENEITTLQDSFRVHLPYYNYLVYLRQHGFPSPLLDWTASPFIAAFFAFWPRSEASNAAVYVYVESTTGVRTRFAGAPQISVQEPYVKTHSRHFLQQARYTIATRFDRNDKRHSFCSHDEVFSKGAIGEPRPSAGEQDILIKIVLPSALREVSLKDLLDYNIHPYSLFQTEDALVSTMELKEFDPYV